ncbi:MAG: hypothetical protein MJY96_08185 [Bacteroidaceae bacterium]|nr:hypothetical protein [Bacteroidaceae bacterium]
MDTKQVKDWLEIINEILLIIKTMGENAAIDCVALKYGLPVDEVRKHFKARK